MFRESTSLEFKTHFTDNVSIPVAAYLNTKGGTLIMSAYGPKFQNEDDVTKGIKQIINRLYNDISGFSTTLVSFTSFPIGNNVFLIVIDVDYSGQLHSIKRNGIDIYYFRQSYKNVGYKKDDAERRRLNAEYGIKLVEPTSIVSGSSDYHKIGNYPTGSSYFKYMSLETALLCLDKQTIRFAEPTSWPDEYEGRFYKAKIHGAISSINNPPLLGCCFTYKQDNEAAWKLYSYEKKGLNSRCVEFRLNRTKLREQLVNSLPTLSTKFNLYEGCVEYWLQQKIDNLSKPTIKVNGKKVHNPRFDAYFNVFTLEKYLNLMLLKRNAFLHEQEARFFLVPLDHSYSTKSNCVPEDVLIDWSDIILDVRIDAQCTDFEKGLLEEKLRAIGCAVPVEPFDVYKEKNKKRLKI